MNLTNRLAPGMFGEVLQYSEALICESQSRNKVRDVSLSRLDASAARDVLGYEYCSSMKVNDWDKSLWAVSTGALELATRQRSMSSQSVPS